MSLFQFLTLLMNSSISLLPFSNYSLPILALCWFISLQVRCVSLSGLKMNDIQIFTSNNPLFQISISIISNMVQLDLNDICATIHIQTYNQSINLAMRVINRQPHKEIYRIIWTQFIEIYQSVQLLWYINIIFMISKNPQGNLTQ